jgi:WD40 repeat protein
LLNPARLTSGSWDRAVKIRDTSSSSEPLQTGDDHGHEKLITLIVFSPDLIQFTSGSIDKTIKVWS